MTRVLVVDDEPQILRGLKTNLTARGYDVDTAPDGERALALAADRLPGVVILDLGLPGIDGVDVIRGIRAWSTMPIIVLSARDQERDMVLALDAGADDYVIKPFTATQLDARIRAVLRRSGRTDEDPVITVGGLRIDTRSYEVSVDGRAVELARKEFELLLALARRAGEVVSKRDLLAEVWQLAWGGSDRTVDVHLSWLRRKLGETAARPRYLHSCLLYTSPSPRD